MHTTHRFSASRVTMNAGQFWAVQAHVWVTSRILLVPLVCDRITLDTSFGRTLTPELIRSKKFSWSYSVFCSEWKSSQKPITRIWPQGKSERSTKLKEKLPIHFSDKKIKHLLSIILFLSLTVFHIFSHLKK